MQLQPERWVQIAQAIGPYATAIAALIAVTISSLFAMRNWRNQFIAEKSYLILQEKIRLLHVIPQKLAHIAKLHIEFLLFSARWEAQVIAIEQGHLREEELISADNVDVITKQITDLLLDLGGLQILSDIYFGSNTSNAFGIALKQIELFSIKSKEYTEMRSLIYDKIVQVSMAKIKASQAASQMISIASQIPVPLLESFQKSIQHVIQCMGDEFDEDKKSIKTKTLLSDK